MSKKDNHPVQQLIALHSQDLSYCDPTLKASYHREAKKVMRLLAARMGLKTHEYDVRSNMGGIAVSGEIIMHTDYVYVHISQTVIGNNGSIMMRSCNDRKDYTGGMNHFAPIEVLQDLERLALYLEGIAHHQVCGMHWNPEKVRFDVANIRANKIISPELEHIKDRFESGEITIEDFEHAIDNAERMRTAA